MKATEQYFPVVLFIMLYKVVLTFESANYPLFLSHCVKLNKRIAFNKKDHAEFLWRQNTMHLSLRMKRFWRTISSRFYCKLIKIRFADPKQKNKTFEILDIWLKMQGLWQQEWYPGGGGAL